MQKRHEVKQYQRKPPWILRAFFQRCPSFHGTLLVPAASGKAVSSLSVRTVLLPQKLVLRGPLLKFHSSLGMRDHSMGSHSVTESLDTLRVSTSRHNRSHYHFWECCLPIAAKDAEIPLIFNFMSFQLKCGFIRPRN